MSPVYNSVKTIQFSIYIGGDIDVAKQACREFCFDVGLCVTVEAVSFIYTGGEEAGVKIGLINYPRFPTNFDDLSDKATNLANVLLDRLCQNSYSIVGPHFTEWHSRRDT